VVIYIVAENADRIPLDARLLGDAIIELNISRRNVSIYPRDHPSVDKSLGRAFAFMEKLFELRPEITLAVAKDTLIIDDYYLDKKNPVYREFALHLSDMSISHVTFVTGLGKEELYAFHRFISEKRDSASVADLENSFRELNLLHIRAGFIDYGAFRFVEGASETAAKDPSLWERYVYGLLEGTLQTNDIADGIVEIPPDMLARFVNRMVVAEHKEETYDSVITSYVRRSTESAFTSRDLRRLLDFINGLRPELKKQFLTSTVRVVSKDLDAAYKSLRGVSVDEIIELLGVINEQKVVIPDALKNLLDKFSLLPWEGVATPLFGGGLLVDDIFLSPDIVNLLREDQFGAFIDSTYHKEIQKVMAFKAPRVGSDTAAWEQEFSEEAIERDFNRAVLEVLRSDVISSEEYQEFVDLMREQTEQFVWTGQYGRLIDIVRLLSEHEKDERFSEKASEALAEYYSDAFVGGLIESFRVVGRQVREEAWKLCDFYGERIIPKLIDALIDDSSQVNRRFFIGILKEFGDRIIPEVLRKLGDSRWYVKRNMLYILGDCQTPDIVPHIRPYCRHENRKVSIEAIKCLLNVGDRYGIDALKDYIRSESGEAAREWIALAGAYRVRELVPDLLAVLRKRALTGSDLYEKIPVVKALGEIGDPRALDALRDLVLGKSILFRNVAERVREEFYRTLKQYPLPSVKDFIEAGLKSKNKLIREESERLSTKDQG